VHGTDGHGLPFEAEPQEVVAARSRADEASGDSHPRLPQGNWHVSGGAALPLRGSMSGQDRKISAAKSGGLMGAALTREGKLVTFGWQGWGALGRGSVSTQASFSPLAAALPFHKVVAFGTGDSHALCACPALGDRHALTLAPLLRDPDLLKLASVTLWPAR